MAVVWIPALLRDAVGGLSTVDAPGATVAEVVDALERAFPGVKDRLCDAGALRRGLAVTVDAQVCPAGLRQAVRPDSEIHFLPAIGGG